MTLSFEFKEKNSHFDVYRAVRARYPNVGKVEFVLGAMQVITSTSIFVNDSF